MTSGKWVRKDKPKQTLNVLEQKVAEAEQWKRCTEFWSRRRALVARLKKFC